MTMASVKIYFDGGSRGNPGPASGAAYADWQGGQERACFMTSATNNEAEYRGLLTAIALALELKLTDVLFLGDSKLVVMQISGEWQAKHALMHELRQQALQALAAIPRWQIQWIERARNGEADRIANAEMDRQLGIVPILLETPPEDPLPAAGQARLRPDLLKLNRLGPKAGFGDFKQLKVGGRDEFSRATLQGLEQPLSNFAELNQAFAARLATDRLTEALSTAAKDKLLLNALRWSARGLAGDLALRKVLVDLEITNNIRGKKS